MTPTLAALLAKVEELDKERAACVQEHRVGFAYRQATWALAGCAPAMAKALKLAMEIVTWHARSAVKDCHECSRPWPCPAAAKRTEIESFLAEALK